MNRCIGLCCFILRKRLQYLTKCILYSVSITVYYFHGRLPDNYSKKFTSVFPIVFLFESEQTFSLVLDLYHLILIPCHADFLWYRYAFESAKQIKYILVHFSKGAHCSFNKQRCFTMLTSFYSQHECAFHS